MTLPVYRTKLINHDSGAAYLVTVTAPTDMAASFYEYSTNYNKAAHLITLSILDTDKPSIAELDTYFFSLAFLYRHSLELILKAIAFQYLCSTSDQAEFIKDTFHNLDEILKYIERFFSSPRPRTEMDWLRSYLGDISRLDKESDSFRYPFHIISEKDQWSGGRRYSVARIFEKQTHIDLIKFANKFEAAYEILDKWYLQDGENAVEWRDLAPVFIEEGGY